MLFHSWDFFFFFLVFYPVYLGVRRTRFRNGWVLLGSYVFYGWWSPAYLLLVVGTTALDYAVVRRMAESARPGRWLTVSLVSNLGVLVFLKYTPFLVGNLNALLVHAGVAFRMRVPSLPLPLGVSFFTFQSISYVVDVYRGVVPAERSFIKYATYVAFFPQMIAGPISRAGSLLPQLGVVPRITPRDLSHGCSLFLIGLFKKVALADYFAMYVDRVLATPGSQPGSALFLAILTFSWQIYFDFSGYTDMARGVAQSMGIELAPNFDAPYVAGGLGEFWRRWNISVSTWFRDYVYIPLGGNRKGGVRTSVNVFLTMLTSGFWHGASWNFVLWGALHGAARVATKELAPAVAVKAKLPVWVRRPVVFLFVTFAWIFFRIPDFDTASLVAIRIFTAPWGNPGMPLLMIVFILMVWSHELLVHRQGRIPRWLELAPLRVSLAVFLLGYLVIVTQPSTRAFIYFQF
jgi:D-alanyl-lipoteichoic acid acyltransferase DltB (MBOAT superfamily)